MISKKTIIAAALVFSSPVIADDSEELVSSASAVCAMLDASGSLSKPCDVSVWDKAVEVSIAMSVPEAIKTCGSISEKLRGPLPLLHKHGWRLNIYSPYSGDNTIASCPF